VVATEQDGVVSLGQLRASGISKRASNYRAEVHQLHRVHRGIYAVGHEAIGWHGGLRAAILACGPGSAISHLSAAALWGLRDVMPAVVDVIVPCETGRKIHGIRARRCRYPLADEVTVHEGLSCTTPSRTLVDLAGALGKKSLRRAVERAAVLRLLDIAALDAAMAQASGRRGIPALRAIVAMWRGWDEELPRLRSVLEARLLTALVDAGIPLPRCNVKLKIDGELVEVDLLWEKERLAIETDGEQTHGTRAAFQRDRWRDQVLIAAGYRVARVTWRQVKDEPAAVVARIRRMVDSRAPTSPRGSLGTKHVAKEPRD
jgi:very-short-patch-repair endonuclease